MNVQAPPSPGAVTYLSPHLSHHPRLRWFRRLGINRKALIGLNRVNNNKPSFVRVPHKYGRGVTWPTMHLGQPAGLCLPATFEVAAPPSLSWSFSCYPLQSVYPSLYPLQLVPRPLQPPLPTTSDPSLFL